MLIHNENLNDCEDNLSGADVDDVVMVITVMTCVGHRKFRWTSAKSAHRKRVRKCQYMHYQNLNDSDDNLSGADVDDVGHGISSDDVRGPS